MKRRALRPTPGEGVAVEIPEAGFQVICADPPWRHQTWSAKGGRKAHYRTMPTKQICRMRIGQRFAAKNTFLFLWTTGPHLQEALRVMKAWGFNYSGYAFLWVKTNPNAPQLFWDRKSWHMGMGHTTRKNVELCLLGRRGKPKRLRKDVLELIIAPRRKHSQKPDEFYEKVVKFADGPRLDLFNRTSHDGFIAWGDEAGKFDHKGAFA